MNENKYQNPMNPWPGLEKYSKKYTLKNKDLTVFYFEAGQENPNPMILIHGLGDEADTWRYLFEPLAKEFHVFAVDLPGFGRSDKPDLDYTPQFFLSTINDFFEAMSMNKVILMGSSLGAILSQGFALQYPEKVSGLILLGGALIQNEASLDLSMKLMRIPILGEWLYTRLRKDPEAAFNSLRNVYHDLDSMSKEDREFLFQRVNKRVWSDGQKRAYFSTLRNLTGWVKQSQKGLAEQLARINIPTLVIRGEYDQLFSAENAEGVVEAQSNAALVHIQGAGHLPQQEAPSVVVNEILSWKNAIVDDN